MIKTMAKIVGMTPMVDTPFATLVLVEMLALENVVFSGISIVEFDTIYKIPGTNTIRTAITRNWMTPSTTASSFTPAFFAILRTVGSTPERILSIFDCSSSLRNMRIPLKMFLGLSPHREQHEHTDDEHDGKNGGNHTNR